MNHNTEREFKTVIPKTEYERIIAFYNLEDNIFLQTNHYFDTQDLALSKQDIVVRIRQKGDRFYKVTIKKQHPDEAFESHFLLTKEQALDMIEKGFNTQAFIPNLNYQVTYLTSIDNYRASMPYLNGTMYIDRCAYCGTDDFELEYEVSDEVEGFQTFMKFLDIFGVEFKKTRRKSDRAFSCTLK
jgi:uncharacterized protein YjbK